MDAESIALDIAEYLVERDDIGDVSNFQVYKGLAGGTITTQGGRLYTYVVVLAGVV